MKILLRQLRGDPEWGAAIDRFNVSKELVDYENQISTVTIQGGFHSLFMNNGVLSFGLYAGVDGIQDIAVVPLDLGLLFSKEYKQVLFACYSPGRRPNNLEIIGQSTYYGRRDDGDIVDLRTGLVINQDPKSVFTVWIWATNLGFDTGYCVLNPDLVSLRTNVEGVDSQNNKIFLLNNDYTLRSYFSPQVESGATLVNNNTLVSTGDKIITLASPASQFKLITTTLPEDCVIISNDAVHGSRISINISGAKKKAWDLVTLKIETSSSADSIFSKESNLTYSFFILR